MDKGEYREASELNVNADKRQLPRGKKLARTPDVCTIAELIRVQDEKAQPRPKKQ